MGRPGAGGAILVIVVSVLCGCASFRPQPLEVVGFRERAATREDGQVRVTAAVPSAAESAALFGVDVATQGIQPVWLRIENHDDVDYFFLPISLDPHYFSSQEAAWQSRFWLGGAAADLGGGSCAQHRRSPGVGFSPSPPMARACRQAVEPLRWGERSMWNSALHAKSGADGSWALPERRVGRVIRRRSWFRRHSCRSGPCFRFALDNHLVQHPALFAVAIAYLRTLRQ